MPLKDKYEPNRLDAADLTRDAQPGQLLYTALGGEFIVTDDISAITGGHMVRPADTPAGPGSISLAQLLARGRGVSTQPTTQN
ncbi:hypothetical protein ACFU5Y_04325 [Streptomyces gardneri]|uniref:hypothetical protein n=1 Tax=Streptomyces gardneri TaxID=66892 RepID=UPI00368D212A